MNNDMTGKELQDFQTREEPDATLKGEAPSVIVVRCVNLDGETYSRTDEVYVRWEDVRKIRHALLDLAGMSDYPHLAWHIEKSFKERFADDLNQLQSQWGTDALMKMLQPDAEVN